MDASNESTARDGIDVVVIGGGLAGISAARHLKASRLNVVLLEKDIHIGGRAATTTVAGQNVDVGAAFISDFYVDTLEMIRSSGLDSKLLERSQGAYIVTPEKSAAIWPAPELMKNDALSFFSKLRILCLIPVLLRHWKHLDITDLSRSEMLSSESAEEFAKNSIGSEASNYFFTPLLRGLLYWDASTTSAPVVWSILKAFSKSKKTYRVDNGMRSLAESLATDIDVVTSAEVGSWNQQGDASINVYAKVEGVDRIFRSRAVICAVPAPAALGMNKGLEPDQHEFLASVGYSKTIVLTFEVDAAASEYPPGAMLFPTESVHDIASVNPLYAQIDGPDSLQGPSSARLLNVYLSDQGYFLYAKLDDKQLSLVIRERLDKLLKHPAWLKSARLANVQRWPEAIPKFDVGYVRRSQKFKENRSSQPIVAYAGDYLDGPYIDGAVRSGIHAARQIVAALRPADC